MENNETPWAVICPIHGLTYLTYEQYVDQMYKADYFWKCPICDTNSEWSDENYELSYGKDENYELYYEEDE